MITFIQLSSVGYCLSLFMFFINQSYRHSRGRLQTLFHAHFEDVLVYDLDMQILNSTIL